MVADSYRTKEVPMLCPHCSAELPDDAQFCGECGADVTTAPKSSQQQLARTSRGSINRVNEQAELARNSKIGVAVVVSLAAITVVCAIIAILLLT